MLLLKNAAIRFILIGLLIFTLVTTIVFYFLIKFDSIKNQINDIDKTNKQMNDKNQLKFIIFECKNHCGGFADRLKGDIKFDNLFLPF